MPADQVWAVSAHTHAALSCLMSPGQKISAESGVMEKRLVGQEQTGQPESVQVIYVNTVRHVL